MSVKSLGSGFRENNSAFRLYTDSLSQESYLKPDTVQSYIKNRRFSMRRQNRSIRDRLDQIMETRNMRPMSSQTVEKSEERSK